ncbi:MAG: FAD-dependent thymidylate synthase [Acidobacteria bacterium]|nr:FAD-dependent thymidylate synthase [Acidobacteriota bacterium]
MNFNGISATQISVMGSDLSVVNAARVSMAKQSVWNVERKGFFLETTLNDKDTKLIGYLAKHKHWTPFSHPQISLHIRAPIFVARQWFKHMIGITRNETSRRYVDSEPDFFRLIWRMRAEAVKQGSAGVAPTEIMEKANEIFDQVMTTALAGYEELLSLGIAPEQARAILPQNMMTEWIETASLAAICRACKLRLDPHAQLETREVAERIAEIVAPHFPVSWAALMGENNG